MVGEGEKDDSSEGDGEQGVLGSDGRRDDGLEGHVVSLSILDVGVKVGIQWKLSGRWAEG